MRRLFAEAFTVPLLEPDSPELELHYDEERCMNVDSEGRVFVETGLSSGGADTFTEVRAEQDDFDRGDAGRLDTVTKVRREGDDFESRFLMLATETRVPGERDDFARGAVDPCLGTKTSVRGESDDFASEQGGTPRSGTASAHSS